jgi:hypothetical protein
LKFAFICSRSERLRSDHTVVRRDSHVFRLYDGVPSIFWGFKRTTYGPKKTPSPSPAQLKVSWDQQEGRYTNYDSDLQVAIVLPGLRVRSIVHVFNSRSHTITAPIRNRVPAIRKKSSRAGALRSLGPPNQLIKIRGDTIAKTATAAKGSNTTGNSLSVVISITSLQTKRTTNSV